MKDSDYYSVPGHRPQPEPKKARKKKKPGRAATAVDGPEEWMRCLRCTIPASKCNGHCRPGEEPRPRFGSWPETQRKRAKEAAQDKGTSEGGGEL